MEFHDRRGEGGTGKGRLVNIDNVGIGHEQRKFNRRHFNETAGTAVYGHFPNGALTKDIKGLTVEEAQRSSDNGRSIPVGGDELSRATRKKKAVE